MMMVLFLTPLSMAEFASDVTILDKQDIVKLSDEQLTDTYMNTLVEMEDGMFFFAQVPLLDPPIDQFSVRAPTRGEVFPHGPEFFGDGQSRHALIIAPNW